MGPKVDKTRKKSAADDDTGEAEDIVLRVMEALTDERIAKQLRKMLLPQALMEKNQRNGSKYQHYNRAA